MVTPLRKVLAQLDANIERWLMLVAYVLIVFVIVNEVVRRFVLSYSSLWGEEIARYAFVFLGWVGASYAVKQRAHIRFDTVLNLIPARFHGYVYLFGDFVALVFACFAVYWTMHAIGALFQFDAKTPALRVSKAWFELAVPFAFVLMFFRLLQSIVRDWRDLKAGREAFSGKLLFDL
jgi:TRAP-type C4-dicarboxylate transport system permease small subunit